MLLNADLGEGVTGEEQLIPYLHLASISCGAHAGDESTIRRTIRLCARQGVRVGAHPSFIDRAHFGRIEQSLSPGAIEALVIEQLELFRNWTSKENASIFFVKPHGALYNLAARDRDVACSIATAIKKIDPTWALMGLAGSVSIEEARSMGLTTISEAFADRRYRSDGSLCPRTDPRALMEDPTDVVEQVRHLRNENRVYSIEGAWVQVHADAVCVHGDGTQALAFVRSVRHYLDI